MKTEIQFMGFIPDVKWKHYLWHILIGDQIFQYKTGIGNALSCTKKYNEGWNHKPKDRESIKCAQTDSWVYIPKIDDVLNNLFDDARAGSESFNDFCDNLGYSNDSLAALDVYRSCMELGTKLRKALGNEYYTELKRIEKLREEGIL